MYFKNYIVTVPSNTGGADFWCMTVVLLVVDGLLISNFHIEVLPESGIPILSTLFTFPGNVFLTVIQNSSAGNHRLSSEGRGNEI